MKDTVTRSTPTDFATPIELRSSRDGSSQAKLVRPNGHRRAGIEGLDVYRVAIEFYRLAKGRGWQE